MTTQKDTFHVVIRIPIKRPNGFVEPPSIIWTDDMEQKLWQYTSQKNTDWNVIAEQLGVPTSYIVRRAAFNYENQLRDIHQQFQLNGNTSTSSITKTSIKSPSLSRPTSARYVPQVPTENESPSRHDKLYESNSTVASKTQPSLENSNKSSTSSRLYTDTHAYIREDSDDDDDMIREQDKVDHEEEEEEDDEEDRFSSHFKRIQLEVEEPAFLTKRLEGSTTNLSASRQQLSLSIQNLRKPMTTASESSSPKKVLSPQTHSPATRTGSSNANSSTSSFSDISETSVTQSAMEDAFLSNFDHGGGSSKISSFMSFSRK